MSVEFLDNQLVKVVHFADGGLSFQNSKVLQCVFDKRLIVRNLLMLSELITSLP